MTETLRELFVTSTLSFLGYDKKFLLANLVSRNLKLRYRRSFLGFFWTLLSPLGSALTYYIVFKHIFKVDIQYYSALIVTGLLCWQFFSTTINESLEILVGNFYLIKQVPLPIYIFSYATSLTNFVTLTLSLPVVVLFMYIAGAPIGLQIFAFIPLLIMLFMMAYSMSIVASILFVFVRDLRQLIVIILQLWMYATPIFYQTSMLPKFILQFYWLNPIGHLFSAFHSIIHGHYPTKWQFLIPLAWTSFFYIMAIVTNKYLGKRAIERI